MTELTNVQRKSLVKLANDIQRLINQCENQHDMIIDVEVRRLRERGSLAPIVKVTAHGFRGWEEEIEDTTKKQRRIVLHLNGRD